MKSLNPSHQDRHTGGSRRPGAASGQTATAHFLFASGWIITLLYFPSGLMHAWLGSGVYARDGLLFLHLCGCIGWLAKRRELVTFAQRYWPLLVPAVFILPAAFDADARVEALTFIKWTALWVDWIILGRLASTEPDFSALIKTLLAVTALLLIADLVAGAYERATHNFVITGNAGEVTAFGVEMDREHSLGDQLRVKGLQRDVFSFANLMGMSAVVGLWVFVTNKIAAIRMFAVFWAVSFAVMLLMSGGRSALFGLFASCLIAGALLFAPEFTRRNYAWIILSWLLGCLLISSVGVGRLSESVGGSVLSGSSVGNSTSAYMRDNAWAGILDAIKQVPVVLAFGSPFSNLLDPKVEPFYHWADNEYFWLFYHTGVMGFAALVWYFRARLVDGTKDEPDALRDAVVIFLLFVMGEAIARESLTFIGSLPLFVAIGAYEAGRGGDRLPQAEPRRRSVAISSDVSDFSRRIKARAKNKT